MKKARSLRQRWLDRGAEKTAKREAAKAPAQLEDKPVKVTKSTKKKK